MSSDDDNEVVGNEYTLSELLLLDTPEIKEQKSIYGKEEDYSDYLSEIEYAIAEYYYEENRNIKDKDVVSALKNIKQNRDKPITFFTKDLETNIIESLIELLEDNPITNHEFTLIIDYILWSIENRSWVEDKQAYVKWITYVLGFLSNVEEEKYERQFKKIASKFGLSAAQVDMLLMKKDVEDFFKEGAPFEGIENMEDYLAKERATEELETGFFLMNDEEKNNFLLDKGPDYFELIQDYILDLKGKEDYEKIQTFYKNFIGRYKDFFPILIIIGTVYIDKDPNLARSYLEEAIRAAEKQEEIPEETKKDLIGDINRLIQLITEDSTEKPEGNIGKGKKDKKKIRNQK